MSLEKYPSAVYGLADEILHDFSEDEIASVYEKLKALGFGGWLDWKRSNHELVVAYLEATPSQRAKLKKFKSHLPLLAFAAYQHCLAGYEFLRQIEGNFIAPGQSYRGMAAASARAFYKVEEAIEHELWPWGGDPFATDT